MSMLSFILKTLKGKFLKFRNLNLFKEFTLLSILQIFLSCSTQIQLQNFQHEPYTKGVKIDDNNEQWILNAINS